LRDYGHVPGGKNELRQLLYPFYNSYPQKFWSKFRWFLNIRLKYFLEILSHTSFTLTIINRLGAPGDTLITANVIYCIKKKYPKIKINIITPFQELIKFDPNINSINSRETFFSFDSSYIDLIRKKEAKENIISHNLSRLGIKEYEYKARYYIHEEETLYGRDSIKSFNLPIITICTRSKEPVKNWATNSWINLINKLSEKFVVVQLGDGSEPRFDKVIRLAGKLSMRESAAIVQHSKLFIGPDSLLMHIANGLGIKSIIIFGGSRPVSSFGYKENININSTPKCSPCWIHKCDSSCPYDLQCLNDISVKKVWDSIRLMNIRN
jgi:ADP-heptose:LPS heptosyltransferase